MKISIILPLFDRRNAGWKALESALCQSYPRDRYEVVLVDDASEGTSDQKCNTEMMSL